ncbi:AI-2E family transporter [Ruthenibacterium sp. CLA-JM-H11]|uniref:AI-2E family transporter n=1 Tax=Ruthenibacterium intestinale TaxID=3133163 RepID=A0ABV1GDK9_9FIRM
MSKENKWQVTGRVASNLIVVFAGVAFYMALSNFDALRAQLRAWLGILSPFVWGLVIAYLLDAPVRFFESKLGGRRKLSILISYVLAFLVVGFLLRMVLPQIGNGFISAVTALISSVYMLMGKDRLLRQLRKAVLALLPLPRARSVLEVCSRANRVFGGFIIGKIIDSSIIGVLCFVCMTLLRLPFAVLISVIVGVTNIIPFFGPFIGAVPSILILLIVDPIAALKFAVLVLLQQFDGNILGPKILGDSTGLSALWVLVAIIVSGGLFGFAGMVVGVPVFAVLYALASSFFARRLWEKASTKRAIPCLRPTLPEPFFSGFFVKPR